MQLLEQTPVVAAVKDEAGLARSLACPAPVVFILNSALPTLPGHVARLREAGKAPFVHMDLVDGLAPREAAVDYIAGATGAAGILSTRQGLAARAVDVGLVAVRRFFLLDSMALHGLQQLSPKTAHFIEVLPGVMPKVLRQVAEDCPLPMIAGGLVRDKEDVMAALGAGAVAVSSTNSAVWAL